ncbi:MAG: ATP-binding protein [Gemmatimonadaceae bacterium]|jgi:two-component system sensor histidine kinase PilS (NtrC family)|nr:ATP-binding protein [Gemmatimonadaceae bacterium]
MATTPTLTPLTRLRTILDPRRAVLGVYAFRSVVAIAVIVALPAIAVGQGPAAVRLVQVAAVLALAATGLSLIATEIYRLAITRGFLLGQAVVDLLLVAAVVHVTGGSESPFAALYILVIAWAALLLPRSGGVVAAVLACALFVTDALVTRDFEVDAAALLQLGNFVVVALGVGYVSARLRDAGSGSEQLAETIVREREQAADILENIRSGVLTMDARGILRFANPAASQLLGIDLVPRIGTVLRADLARVAPGLVSALEAVLASQQRTTRAEATVFLADRAVPIGLTVTWVGAHDGRAASATAIFSDIAEAKRLQDLTVRASRLEAISELSASLAHEIRNPLASIRSAVEQLGRMPSVNEDQVALTGLVVRESDRIARLLGEFLDFARVRKTNVAPLDAAQLVVDVASLVTAHPDRAASTAIELEVRTRAATIDGDADLLHRALFNLALNAVQAVGQGGRVRLVVGDAAADALGAMAPGADGAVELRVEDDGPGMPDDVRTRIFTPFYTTKPQGSGLGLPVVHRAIEAHRGAVYVESAPGRGTRFTIVLPRTQGEAGVAA